MSINLIPQQLKKDKDVRTIAGQVIFASVSILLMIVLLAAAFYIYNKHLADYSTELNTKLSRSEAMAPSYKDTETKITAVNSKLSLIDNILQSSFSWSEVMAAIAGSTPKNVQIKSLSLSQESGSASITGIAAEKRDIALFKEKLDTFNFLQNVAFTILSYNAATNNYSFTLKFEVIKTGK